MRVDEYMSSDMEGRMQDQIEGAISANEQLGRDLMELEDVLRRNGFVRCDIPACNCGSWHGRYGIFERFAEIKEALQEAGVLNNETGNLPLRAIQKLVQQRGDAKEESEEDEAALSGAVTTISGLMEQVRALTAENLKLVTDFPNWIPIADAPMHKEVLAWREDAGAFVAIYTCAAALMDEREIESCELDEEALHGDRWFAYAQDGLFSMEGDETPTHWMPMPEGPNP